VFRPGADGALKEFTTALPDPQPEPELTNC
jgi:hypothetical protein